MGRKCAVPHCYTGYRKCKEKASLYRVPDDDFFLSKWQEAIAREDRPITPKDYVCEKHFKDDDILRRRIIKDVVEEYQRPRLKPDAIPSIFPDLPEFILKMVKKRRKITLGNSKTNDTCDSLKNNSVNENNTQNTSEKTFEQEIKIELPETNETENLPSTMCETILNNELDIKSEPEEQTDRSMENEEDEKYNLTFGPKMYECDQCDYQTKYPHNLRTHKTKHLTGEKAYIHCKQCPNFKTKWELTYRNHLKIKHGIGKQEIFKCHLCAFETKVKLCLKRHFERHQRSDSIKTLLCNFPGCDFKNGNKEILTLHKLSHDLEATTEDCKNFKCTECFYETNSKTHIIRHIKSTHNAGDDTIVSVNPSHKSICSSDDSKLEKKCLYKCLRCSYRSKSQSNLLKHVFKHKYPKSTGDKMKSNVWKCPKCPFATFFQHALQKHQETDCGNLFICDDCNFKSNHKPDFINHLLTHRNISVESINQREAFRNNSEINTVGLEQSWNKEDPNNVNFEGDGTNNVPEFVTVKSEILDVE